MALLLKHQTVAQFVARVREAYRSRDRDELAYVRKDLMDERIAALNAVIKRLGADGTIKRVEVAI